MVALQPDCLFRSKQLSAAPHAMNSQGLPIKEPSESKDTPLIAISLTRAAFPVPPVYRQGLSGLRIG